jgi:TrmH family RNA methyltransferase
MISSTHNPAVRRIRSLRSRKGREETGLFLAEGIRIVGEAAELGAEIESLVTAPELLTSDFARGLVERLRGTVPVLELSPAVFESISGKEGPQGIAAVIRQRLCSLDQTDPRRGLCWIALEGVADPGNLGSILRTSDAAGAAGILLLGATTDPYDPSAVRGSMGALFSQQLVRTDLNNLRQWSGANDIAIVGTGDAATLDYREAEYRRPLILLMGSERQGLSPEARALCGALVRIPMTGRSDSLNLAVATGVMLYELYDRAHPIHRPALLSGPDDGAWRPPRR